MSSVVAMRGCVDCGPTRMARFARGWTVAGRQASDAKSDTKVDARGDEELMLAYASGDAAAFSILFRRVSPMLLRIAQRQLRRAADAQDTVQQTFLQLHRARRDFKQGMKLRPWIVTITMNLARDLLRRRGRWQTTDIDEQRLAAPDTVAEARHSAAEAGRVRTALATLPTDQREVIELHWFEELPFAEIASVVAASPGAVRVRAHRGYVTLRKLLGPESELPMTTEGPDGGDGAEGARTP